MMQKLELVLQEELEKRLRNKGIAGKTITLKLSIIDFATKMRVKPYLFPDKVCCLRKRIVIPEIMKNSVRLLGISLSNLNTNRPSLFKLNSILNSSTKLNLF
jgi:DNA polymerase-4